MSQLNNKELLKYRQKILKEQEDTIRELLIKREIELCSKMEKNNIKKFIN